MPPAPAITDLTGLEVEHLVGDATGLPLVKVRAHGTDHGRVVLAVGFLEPAQAREVAANLLTAAARAEYEVDLIAGLRGLAGLTDNEIGAIVHAVRSGEKQRETGGGDAG